MGQVPSGPVEQGAICVWRSMYRSFLRKSDLFPFKLTSSSHALLYQVCSLAYQAVCGVNVCACQIRWVAFQVEIPSNTSIYTSLPAHDERNTRLGRPSSIVDVLVSTFLLTWHHLANTQNRSKRSSGNEWLRTHKSSALFLIKVARCIRSLSKSCH